MSDLFPNDEIDTVGGPSTFRFAPTGYYDRFAGHVRPAAPTPLDAALTRLERSTANGRDYKIASDLLAHDDLPEGVFAPICLAPMPHLPPHGYVFQHYTSYCTCCHSEHRWTELFEFRHIRIGRTYTRNMHRITSLQWNLPITHHYPKPRSTAHCFECIGCATLLVQTLPTPPILTASPAPQSTTLSNGPRMAKPAIGSSPTKAPKSTTKYPKNPTLDDVL